MKVNIIIEQFDNGITIVADDAEAKERRVVLERSEASEIGKLVWEDATHLMNEHTANKCRITVTCEVIAEEK
jgi:hypothetical protein